VTERIAQTSHATLSAPGHVNEDLAASGPGWALVLDGATPAPGVASGCVHDVPWLVRQLAAAVAARLTRAGPDGLAELVAGAIGEVRDAHAGTCDLANPNSPSSTLAVARVRNAAVEYLVLCDSPILLAHPGCRLTLLADDQLASLPGRRPFTPEQIGAWRNKPGGFWVASTDPAAAYHAVRGAASLDSVTDVALFTDGVTRLADWYGYRWPDILARLRDAGPAALLGLVRAAEQAYPHPRQKQHDDATVAHIRW
jgi:Protein phosphatase 2C